GIIVWARGGDPAVRRRDGWIGPTGRMEAGIPLAADAAWHLHQPIIIENTGAGPRGGTTARMVATAGPPLPCPIPPRLLLRRLRTGCRIACPGRTRRRRCCAVASRRTRSA